MNLPMKARQLHGRSQLRDVRPRYVGRRIRTSEWRNQNPPIFFISSVYYGRVPKMTAIPCELPEVTQSRLSEPATNASFRPPVSLGHFWCLVFGSQSGFDCTDSPLFSEACALHGGEAWSHPCQRDRGRRRPAGSWFLAAGFICLSRNLARGNETDFQLGGEILFLLVSFIADLTPR